jgi:hypothetical protein
MSHVSAIFKQKLQRLAGVLSEALNTAAAPDPFAKSNERIPFNQDLMQQAIEQGLAVGLLFQSIYVKYKMPVAKYRIILPVAMGYDKNGQLVIRGVHAKGQSEKKARETGIRSAEATNEWRLFKTSNIKSMFFTGDFFSKIPIGGYNPNDGSMNNVIVSFDAGRAKVYQDEYAKMNQRQVDYSTELTERKKIIRSLFKQDYLRSQQ